MVVRTFYAVYSFIGEFYMCSHSNIWTINNLNVQTMGTNSSSDNCIVDCNHTNNIHVKSMVLNRTWSCLKNQISKSSSELALSKSDDIIECSFEKKKIFNSSRSQTDVGNVPNISKSVHTDTTSDSDCSDDTFGWFEDLEQNQRHDVGIAGNLVQNVSLGLTRSITLPVSLTCPPVYVLESSLSTQQLWYQTAGRRPRQPADEREKFEKIWTENFEKSNASYNGPKLVKKDKITRDDSNLFVIFRGIAVASTAVSKSFNQGRISSLGVQLPRFRVVRTQSRILHAEYLVVAVVDSVSIGVWKRHSDFKKLSSMILRQTKLQPKIISYNEEYDEAEEADNYKNTLSSWQCLIHRQRWFRCLDKEYLGLKCFLLERFMHDLLFESNTPELILDFLGFREQNTNM